MNTKTKREITLHLLVAQKFKCKYCGDPLNLETATIDYVVAKANGGNNTRKNLVVSCRYCNQSKAAMSEKEFKKQVKWKHW